MADGRKAKLLHVETLVYGVPLAVSRQRLDTICDVLEQREEPATLDAAVPVRADMSEDEPRITPEGIAILPVMGTFTKRAGMMDAMSGLQSYAAIGKSFRALVDNPQVRGIVLQIDSPGGQVAGVFELAAEMKAARKRKPIWAVADENAMSAAYLLASTAERIFVSQAGQLGSVGVLATRRDESKAADESGRRTIFVTSGAFKADGQPSIAPTDGEIARLQAKVDQIGHLLHEAVATNRGMTTEAIAALEAGTFVGAEAVRLGLADGIATLGEAVAQMTAKITGRPAAMAATAETQTTAASPQRRGTMAEEQGAGTVAKIADHPEYRQTVDTLRSEAEAAANERLDTVTTLVSLAMPDAKPHEVLAQIDSFQQAKTPLPDIRAWAKAERAKGTTGVAGVTGTQPVQGVTKPKGFAMTSADLCAKRAKELDEDRRNNPLIKRIYGAVA